MYCNKCRLLTDEALCPACGGKKLREALPEDPVFLVAQRYILAGSIIGILESEGIPYLQKGVNGAYMTTLLGSHTEVYEIYVPFAALERAKQCVANFLPHGSFEEEPEP